MICSNVFCSLKQIQQSHLTCLSLISHLLDVCLPKLFLRRDIRNSCSH
jgi:hypothetical protein